MKSSLKIGLALLAAISGGNAPHTSSTTRDLRLALYCLTYAANPLVPRAPGNRYTVVYSRDDKTFQGEHRLLLFVRQNGSRYDAFDIVISGRRYDVENNATMKVGRAGVMYLEDPLGGIWTHDWIASHFVRALKRRPATVSIDRSPLPRPVCQQFGKRV